MNTPSDVDEDLSGALFIADRSNHRIRKVNPAGIISTVAGNGLPGFSGEGSPAIAAQLNNPYGVLATPAGELYIADTSNHRIRKVDSEGNISTFAGTGVPGFGGDAGLATSAQLNNPRAVALDSDGNVLIADSGNNRIRRVTPGGVILTVVGNGAGGFSGDGGPATAASLFFPVKIALDAAGNLFIADSANNRVRKVTVAGIISTVAGDGTAGFSGDGNLATAASLNLPSGVAVNSAEILISDTSNNRVRIVKDGIISTLAGSDPGYSGDGDAPTLAKLNNPLGLSLGSNDVLYISDSLNHLVRKIVSFKKRRSQLTSQ
jgi:sugar lactone lactonase YvrE